MNENGSPDIGLLIADATRGTVDATGPAAAFGRRAEEAGLLDVAYTVTDSPFGPITLAATKKGLVQIGLPNLDPDEVVENVAAKISPRVLEVPGRLDAARRQLDLYFEGDLQSFDLPLDWRLSSEGFRRRVLRRTARIPFGQTLSYSEVAAEAGNPRAQRAAGSALGSNPIPIVVPCHRVLRTGGALGGYGGGVELKEALLKLEGAL
jgi:methylated-DNA-[protein]-cysteine S-methyltransferase